MSWEALRTERKCHCMPSGTFPFSSLMKSSTMFMLQLNFFFRITLMRTTKSSSASLCASDMLEQLVLAGGSGVDEEDIEVMVEGEE